MNPRRMFPACIVLLLFVLSACRPAFSDGDALTKVGDKMPDIRVEQEAGGTFSLAEEKGKVVVVNFWATWCGPCQVEMPELEKEIWQKYKSSPDFAFIAIAREQDKATVLGFQRTHPSYTFPLAWDPNRATYALLASAGIPRTYVVDRRGFITYQGVGFGRGSTAAVDHAVQKALAQN
jgi:thiol-disulfide isomerase/thioredoxin